MRLRGFKICGEPCLHLKADHHAGVGHCGICSCLKFAPLHGNSKFANVVRTSQGDSGEERDRLAQLRLMEKGGKVRNLQPQLRVDISPELPGYERMWWKIDYVYEERINGRWVQVYEDWKGGASWGEGPRLKVALLMGRYCSGGRGIMRISFFDKQLRRMVVHDMRTSYSVRKRKDGTLYADEAA